MSVRCLIQGEYHVHFRDLKPLPTYYHHTANLEGDSNGPAYGIRCRPSNYDYSQIKMHSGCRIIHPAIPVLELEYGAIQFHRRVPLALSHSGMQRPWPVTNNGIQWNHPCTVRQLECDCHTDSYVMGPSEMSALTIPQEIRSKDPLI